MTAQFFNDDLQALWDEQPAELAIPNMKEFTMELQQAHRKEQRRLLYLNFQEVIPAIGAAFWFGWQGLRATTGAWAYFGAALLSLAVGAFLAGTSLRQRQREQKLDNSTRGELERSLSQMQHRAWLYRNVGWWYMLPVAGAITLSLVASGQDFTARPTLIFLGVVAAGIAILFRINRNIGRKKYAPKVEHFTRLLADLG